MYYSRTEMRIELLGLRAELLLLEPRINHETG